MITQNQIPAVIDQTVYDNHGDKIGKVKHVYLDDDTGRPEWLCVQTGLFGANETFVPIQGADVVGDHVEVAFDKDRIKDAPNINVESGGHMSAQEERELYRYYNIDLDDSWKQANQPGETGWAHTAGQRERERLGSVGREREAG
ncbi:PRC-barrel domain-containing protein, partial [Streptosporangium algeriense]